MTRVHAQVLPVALPHGVLQTPAVASPEHGAFGDLGVPAQMREQVHAVELGSWCDAGGCQHCGRPVQRRDDLIG